MATSANGPPANRPKILTTTITAYISEDEDTNDPNDKQFVTLSNGIQDSSNTKTEVNNSVAVPDAPLLSGNCSQIPESSQSNEVYNTPKDGMEASESNGNSNPEIKQPDTETVQLDSNFDNLSHSSSESATSAKEAISDMLRKNKGKRIRSLKHSIIIIFTAPKQFDDGYEDDGFILKAKRRTGDKPNNGHVAAVNPDIDVEDEDMNRINYLFGEYEYEDKEDPKEESEEESILSDPSDLHQESPAEDDLVEDDIENYGKRDKVREKNVFIDDEAIEDNKQEAEPSISEPRFSSDDGSDSNDEEDRAIRAPLRKKDFLDDEAVEDNNLKTLYGWSDCSGSEDGAENWKWAHEGNSEDESESCGESLEDSDESIGDESVEDLEDESVEDLEDETVDDENETVTSSQSGVGLRSGFLDSSDEDDVIGQRAERRRKCKSRPKVIDDEDENSDNNGDLEKEVQVIGAIEKGASISIKTQEQSNEDVEEIDVVSTSSVFSVAPLDPSYQPGRNNRQIFKVTPLETSNQNRIPKSPVKRKLTDKGSMSECVAKKSRACSLSDDFILGHDLIISIDSKNVAQWDAPESVDKLKNLLQKALEKRITSISVKKFQDAVDSRTVVIGLNLNIEHAYDAVVKGPSADNAKEVKSFKAFWGNKVEIRRYPDLSVLASVHFPAATLAEKRNIVPRIIHHIVCKHFVIGQQDIIVFDTEITKVLICRRQSRGTGEEELFSVAESFDALKKKLRDLEDLPLGVSSIRGISPVFRGAEVFLLTAPSYVKSESKDKLSGQHGCLKLSNELKYIPQLVKPYEMVVELETTGKWPDNITALRQVKTQIHYNFMAQIHIKFQLPVKLAEQFLDVVHDGYVFRIHIVCKKEIVLLRQFQSDTGLMLAKRGKFPEADELELRNEFLPTLTSALNGISTRFLTYNTVVRLAKRWLSSQYLSDLLTELVIELIVARIYLSPSDRGYSAPPNSPLTGFMRFLELVCRFKWSQQPLFIELNSDFTEQKMSLIKKNFQLTKSRPPFMICTPYDMFPGAFTQVNGVVNSSSIFDTFVRNAKSTFDCLMDMIQSPRSFNFMKVFHHPIDDYHVIIQIKHEFIATSALSLESNIVLPPNKGKKTSKNCLMPVIDFDVVEQFIKSLRVCYEKEALFFFDRYGGTKILVCFTPETIQKFSKNKSGYQSTDYEQMLENVRSMGHGIVESIQINSEKWV